MLMLCIFRSQAVHALGLTHYVTDAFRRPQLTVDYGLGDWDSSPIEDCSCGAANCRGKNIPFSTLSEADQKRLQPHLSDGTRAEYLHAIGKGVKVRIENPELPLRSVLPPPVGANGVERSVIRLVCPGPGSAEADVEVRKISSEEECVDSIHEYGLYASEDIDKGKRAYEYWMQEWPGEQDTVVDMVFASPASDGDPEEGLMVRFDPRTCGAYRNAKGQIMFSMWHMLVAHSCEPNLVYRNREGREEDNWQTVTACRDIKKGDRLSMDWNCFIWDRSAAGDNVCEGFKFLSPKEQRARRTMTWLRQAPPQTDAPLDKALSPYVRNCIERHGCTSDDDLESQVSNDSTKSLASTVTTSTLSADPEA